MTTPHTPILGRRGFVLGGTAVGASALLIGCTGNEPSGANAPAVATGRHWEQCEAAGKAVTIGFAAPAGRPRLDRGHHRQRHGAGEGVHGRDPERRRRKQ